MSEFEKTEYEKAIDEFVEADKKYLDIEEYFMSGEVIAGLLEDKAPPERIVAEFKLVMEEMKKMLEERNTKLQTAKNALRAAVQLGPSQWRGADGKSTTISYGPFTVSSVTRRSLDGPTLLSLAAKKGFLDQLNTLKTMTKEGHEVPMVRVKHVVDYEGIRNWLKEHKMEEVIDGSYNEEEGTPAVKGPKPLAFLGERKDE